MRRLARFTTAATVALALVAVPLVADWCALSCETADAVASHGATSGAPACHHQSTPAPRLADVPAPCSHDHHPVVVDAATSTAIALRAALAVASPVGAVTGPLAAVGVWARAPLGDVLHAPPLPLTLAVILRV